MENHESKVTMGADEVLLRLLREQNEAALALLYDNRSRLVYSLALSIVGNVSDAEEVTQEVFFRVWQKADTYDVARGSALAWITTMTRRLAIDRTRSKHYKSRGREISLDVSGDRHVHGGVVGSARLLDDLQARQVVKALDQLDGHHREVIQLSYFEGLSHARIADHLDTPLGTVKSRLREAVSHLRKILDIRV